MDLTSFCKTTAALGFNQGTYIFKISKTFQKCLVSVHNYFEGKTSYSTVFFTWKYVLSKDCQKRPLWDLTFFAKPMLHWVALGFQCFFCQSLFNKNRPNFCRLGMVSFQKIFEFSLNLIFLFTSLPNFLSLIVKLHN